MLEVRNRQLSRDVERLLQEIDKALCSPEITPYAARIRDLCIVLKDSIYRNLKDLALGEVSILGDVLSNTQQVGQHVRLLSSRLVTPILRSSPSDRLCLRVISWLHSNHPITEKYPPAFTDGDCAIWPFLHINPIYFFPASEQRGILYLPLYFHEFGHLLYACHRQEMDDLVQDLQHRVEDVLVPASQRGDRHSSIQAENRRMIVMTWYKWAQELFCDAVGLTIGGPSFLMAFSSYLSTLDRGDFYRPLDELAASAHPVTLLRVRLLEKRAQQMGFSDEGESVLKSWEELRSTMGVVEDYHGYYAAQLMDSIESTTNDMLVEASPTAFSGYGSPVQTTVSPDDSPVDLVTKAWSVFNCESLDGYMNWEQTAIKSWLV